MDEKMDGYWGLCPVCHKTDGYVNVGNDHWFICREHKTKWCIGANLFSSSMYETPEDQHRRQQELGFDSFAEVEPLYPASETAKEPACEPADGEGPCTLHTEQAENESGTYFDDELDEIVPRRNQ